MVIRHHLLLAGEQHQDLPTNQNANSKVTGSPSNSGPPTTATKTSPTNSPASDTTSTNKHSSPPTAPNTNSNTAPSNSSKPAVATPAPASPHTNDNNQLSINPSPHTVSQPHENNSQNHGDHILGISKVFLLELGIVIIVIAVIVIIAIIIYKRYSTRKAYNQSPQNFAHKPDLSFTEDYHLKHSRMQAIIRPKKVEIDLQEQLAGKIYQVEFKGTEKTAIMYHRRQQTTAYFEIQVLQTNGAVEIGFMPSKNKQKIIKEEQNIGTAGVGVNNTGFVNAQGQNIYNYSWSLAYGDVFGIGITPQNSKFSERRAWISKNGVLLNFPPSDEMDKWLATIEISAEEKNAYNLGSEKKEVQQVVGEKLDEKQIKQKATRQKSEALLKKQRISLKTFNQFNYYPVIVCHGNKTDSQSTKINVNVGGQVFRMCDSQFRSGLLRDAGFFGGRD